MERNLELRQLYEHLRNELLRSKTKKLEKDSVYLTILDQKSKLKRQQTLRASGLDSSSLSIASRKTLIEQGLISYIDGEKKIILTSIGIWQYELSIENIAVSDLISFIEEKWFDLSEGRLSKMSDADKVALFTAIAVRAFSKKSSLDLREERKRIPWLEATEFCIDFMLDYKIISNEELRTIFKKDTAYIPPHNLYQKQDQLSLKTNHLWVSRVKEWYVNVSDGEVLNEEALKYLLKLILSDKFAYEDVRLISEFCRNASYNFSIKVFDADHIFAAPKYDQIIEKVLTNIALEV